MFVEIPRLTAAVRKCGPDQVTITKRVFTRGGEGLSFAVGARVMKRLGWKDRQAEGNGLAGSARDGGRAG